MHLISDPSSKDSAAKSSNSKTQNSPQSRSPRLPLAILFESKDDEVVSKTIAREIGPFPEKLTAFKKLLDSKGEAPDLKTQLRVQYLRETLKEVQEKLATQTPPSQPVTATHLPPVTVSANPPSKLPLPVIANTPENLITLPENLKKHLVRAENGVSYIDTKALMADMKETDIDEAMEKKDFATAMAFNLQSHLNHPVSEEMHRTAEDTFVHLRKSDPAVVQDAINDSEFTKTRMKTSKSCVNEKEITQWNQADALIKEWRLNPAKAYFTPQDFKELNSIVRNYNEGFRNQSVSAGKFPFYIYLPPQYVAPEINRLCTWLNEELRQCYLRQESDMNFKAPETSFCRGNPIILAAKFYERFESIHPFGDGNGRTGRLLFDSIMIRFGLIPPLLNHEEIDIGAFGLIPERKRGQEDEPVAQFISSLGRTYAESMET